MPRPCLIPHRNQVPGSWILRWGSWILDPGSRLFNPGSRIPGSRHKIYKWGMITCKTMHLVRIESGMGPYHRKYRKNIYIYIERENERHGHRYMDTCTMQQWLSITLRSLKYFAVLLLLIIYLTYAHTTNTLWDNLCQGPPSFGTWARNKMYIASCIYIYMERGMLPLEK